MPDKAQKILHNSGLHTHRHRLAYRTGSATPLNHHPSTAYLWGKAKESSLLENASSAEFLLLGDASSKMTSMRNLLEEQDYTPHFSGHETFPLRQMWLKKAFEARNGTRVPKSVFTDERAIANFGVGKNMVASIKHWALACGVLEEDGDDKSSFRINELWAQILGDRDGALDPFCEHPATPWLAHWRLAGVPTSKHRSTTWWWLFNNVLSPTFTREEVQQQLSEYAIRKGVKASDATLRRDIETCLRGYCPKPDAGVEDMAEPMLAELGLVLDEGRGTFSFRRGPKASLPDGIFDLSVLEFWNTGGADESSLAFEALAHGPGSPGRVFKMDENSLAERLLGLEARTRGHLFWTDSSGIRQVMRREVDRKPANALVKLFLKEAYK